VPLNPRQELLLLALRRAGAELSSQELHRRLSENQRSIGLATVYRQLRWLQQRGLVRSRLLPSGETLYAPVEHDAHHLTCVLCGSSVTLPICPVHDHPLPPELAGGFQPLFHTLEYYGHCADCQAEPERPLSAARLAATTSATAGHRVESPPAAPPHPDTRPAGRGRRPPRPGA
jgi:Fur family ferric uptake transcriptional regulator